MASSVETEETPEHLTCPICFELPEAEVYQCRDGHMLCKTCYFKVEDCPQCRLPFDKENTIRNRPIEEVLKGFWTDCPFKSNGCSERVLKIKLEKHQNECCYDFARLGEFVSICKDIGCITCDFKFNKRYGKKAVEHLVSTHKLTKTSTNFKMELKSFKESAKGGSTGFTFWKPIVIELKEGFLVTEAVLNRKDGSFTTWSLFLQDLNKEKTGIDAVQIEFSVQHGDSLDVDIWKRKPIDLEANETFPRKINFNMNSVGFRPHCKENGSLLINVKMKNGEDGEVEKFECPKRIFLSLTASLTPEAPVRFDRMIATYEAKNVYNEMKQKYLQDRNNVLHEIRKVFMGWGIPEGLELMDLKWIATDLIFTAAQYGTAEAVKYLIERKVNFNICTAHNGSTPLHLTVLDSDKKIGLKKAKLLVELGGADVNALNDHKNSLLHFSALHGNCEFLEYFLQKGLSVHDKDIYNQTPLFFTVLNGDDQVGVDIARRLLENGADAGIKDRNGKTALDIALSNGKTQIVNLLRSYQTN